MTNLSFKSFQLPYVDYSLGTLLKNTGECALDYYIRKVDLESAFPALKSAIPEEDFIIRPGRSSEYNSPAVYIFDSKLKLIYIDQYGLDHMLVFKVEKVVRTSNDLDHHKLVLVWESNKAPIYTMPSGIIRHNYIVHCMDQDIDLTQYIMPGYTIQGVAPYYDIPGKLYIVY
jgi:hypothetical protein